MKEFQTNCTNFFKCLFLFWVYNGRHWWEYAWRERPSFILSQETWAAKKIWWWVVVCKESPCETDQTAHKGLRALVSIERFETTFWVCDDLVGFIRECSLFYQRLQHCTSILHQSSSSCIHHRPPTKNVRTFYFTI